MSNVVISNRSIFNQKIGSIDNNKVFLPFNVSKEQISKLSEMLEKIKITFQIEPDKLEISSLTYNGLNIKPTSRNFANCRFTLSKTYVVTMKQNFINKVKNFYNRLVNNIEERPIFDISNERNLQEALQEATVEIDLSSINANISNGEPNQEQVISQPQILANSPLKDTTINNQVLIDNAVNNQEMLVSGENPNLTQPVSNEVPNPKVKKLKGNVLIIPLVIVWLGIVLVGTVKLVTSILT